jgi:hypothetical protein
MYYVRHMTINASKKTSYINTKVTPALKAEVVSVLERLGVSTTEAVTCSVMNYLRSPLWACFVGPFH